MIESLMHIHTLTLIHKTKIIINNITISIPVSNFACLQFSNICSSVLTILYFEKYVPQNFRMSLKIHDEGDTVSPGLEDPESSLLISD